MPKNTIDRLHDLPLIAEIVATAFDSALVKTGFDELRKILVL
jgi:hypothetical protein